MKIAVAFLSSADAPTCERPSFTASIIGTVEDLSDVAVTEASVSLGAPFDGNDKKHHRRDQELRFCRPRGRGRSVYSVNDAVGCFWLFLVVFVLDKKR